MADPGDARQAAMRWKMRAFIFGCAFAGFLVGIQTGYSIWGA